MPAYVVLLREGPIHNPEEMQKYRSANASRGHNLKPLVVYGKMEHIEGEAGTTEGLIVLEFPTLDEARAWYFSPEYQAAAKHRLAAADYRGFIVEGFDPASFKG